MACQSCRTPETRKTTKSKAAGHTSPSTPDARFCKRSTEEREKPQIDQRERLQDEVIEGAAAAPNVWCRHRD